MRIPELLVDALLEAEDLRAYVRMVAAEDYDAKRPIEENKRLSYARSGGRDLGPAAEFWFVRDPALRRQIASDWAEVSRAFGARAWKGCVVLCGSVMEGILHDALYGVIATNGASISGHAPPKKIMLDKLVQEAEKRGILKGAMPHLSHALRESRNLIHPKKQIDLGLTVSADEAQIAVSYVRVLIQERAKHSDSKAAVNEGKSTAGS